MPNVEESLKEAMTITGSVGAALVDFGSGMTLGTAGGEVINLDVAAAGNTEVIRAKLKTMQSLGLNDEICLLYTSPSPRDATLSRMPSSA